MACGSGCCGLPQSLPTTRPTQPTQSTSTPQLVLGDADSCCNIQVQPAHSSVDDCQDACCDDQARDVPPNDSHGSCNAAPIGSVDVPSCCEGRPFPCCDSSCIDRLALRECASEGKFINIFIQGLPLTWPLPCSQQVICAFRLHPCKIR